MSEAPRRIPRRRLGGLGVALLAAAAVVVVLLIVAQLVLPGIAAQRLRTQLARSGQVREVHVSAFPAVKLLWHRADRVVIRLGDYQVPPAALRQRLGQVTDTGSLDISATRVTLGLLTFQDVALTKRGNRLSAHATVAENDLRAAVPFLTSVTPVASPAGQLVLRGTATVLGLSASVDAVVAARDGNIVVAPDVPFGGLATVTVFSDPHVAVTSVGASPAPGGFVVRGTATVH